MMIIYICNVHKCHFCQDSGQLLFSLFQKAKRPSGKYTVMHFNYFSATMYFLYNCFCISKVEGETELHIIAVPDQK